MISVRQAIENRALKQGMQQERVSVAQNMLKYGAPMDLIRNSTGLSKKEIENLSKK